MTPETEPMTGPSLEQYIETRFNLLTESLTFSHAALKESLAAQYAAADIRYQQRFEAQSDALAAAFLSQQTAMQTAFIVAEKAVQAALAAADRAVSKAELAADKRFESVNEFRQTLTDQQSTFLPRAEAAVATRSLDDKYLGLKEIVDRMIAEQAGVKGGWGYAVGVIGFVVVLVTLAMKFYGG